jgi:tRNA(fMet)-specific endonuclease VapC
VLDILADAEIVYMSIFVLGELYDGFKGGKKEKYNLNILNKFLEKSSVKILNATRETAEFFAFIKHNLKKQGKPLPINDVWIAAHTLESGSTLVTFDKHFTYIEGLKVCFQAEIL